MRSWCAWTVIVLGATSVPSICAPERRAISTSPTVAAVYREDMGLSSDGTPKLVLAVWPNGEVVWSADSINGGAPYYSARVPTKEVEKLFKTLQYDGHFMKSKQRRSYFGPDSAYLTLLIRSKGKEFKASSSHELYEQRGAVATASGISPNGRNRLDTLASQPADYVHFRMMWAETRLALAHLRPSSGKLISGKMEKVRGNVSWIETLSKK